MERLVRRVDWRWDKAACILWADVSFRDGATYSVGLPLAHVTATFDACVADAGLALPPFVGAVDSVDGLWGSIKSVAKSATKPISKVVKTTTKVLSKSARVVASAAKQVDRGISAGAKVLRNPYLTTGVRGLAAAVPFVGGPALAAHNAATKAVATYQQAKSAAALGVRTAQTSAALARGANVVRSVRALAAQAQRDPTARMAIAALKSKALPGA